jgi:spermidine synthase
VILLVTAALSGAAVMVIELAAVRLIAPWFGTSLVVWSNVIAVVLLGLAIGYLLGARLSRGQTPTRPLFVLLSLGALTTAWTPLLAGPLARLFVPEGLSLDQAVGVFRWGSLATALGLFLLPSAVLGGVGPLVTELTCRRGALHAGDAGGRVLFASTLGSLLGVFGTSLWAVPVLGMRGTFFLAAGLLLLAALALYIDRDRAEALPPALLLFLAAGALFAVETPEAHAGLITLAVRESPYQRVRIVDAPDEGKRYLQVNEATNSFQSVWQPEPGLLAGSFYYNDFVLPAWWATLEADADPSPRRWRVLCIGMGAGTAKRVLTGTLPDHLELAFEGIELDPVVVELAREWCDLEEGPHDRIISGLDGRAATRLLAPGFDQIIVDAYANQIELPPHLVTIEFFRELEAKLGPAGWIQVNVGGKEPKAPLVQAIAGTLSRALDSAVLIMQVPGTRHLELVARAGGPPPTPSSERWLPAGMPVDIGRLLEGRDVRGQWAWIGPNSPVDLILTDDRAPVEELELRSLEELQQGS